MRLSDERLEELERLYTPTVIPPCRVCGGDMSVGACGGGEPTLWFCNHAFDSGRERDNWNHYSQSKFVDRRNGNAEIVALIDEVRALRECEKALELLIERIPADADPFESGDLWIGASGIIAARHALAAVQALEDTP